MFKLPDSYYNFSFSKQFDRSYLLSLLDTQNVTWMNVYTIYQNDDIKKDYNSGHFLQCYALKIFEGIQISNLYFAISGTFLFNNVFSNLITDISSCYFFIEKNNMGFFDEKIKISLDEEKVDSFLKFKNSLIYNQHLDLEFIKKIRTLPTNKKAVWFPKIIRKVDLEFALNYLDFYLARKNYSKLKLINSDNQVCVSGLYSQIYESLQTNIIYRISNFFECKIDGSDTHKVIKNWYEYDNDSDSALISDHIIIDEKIGSEDEFYSYATIRHKFDPKDNMTWCSISDTEIDGKLAANLCFNNLSKFTVY